MSVLARMMGVVDRANRRINGDVVLIDGVPVRAMYYDGVREPMLGGAETEMVEPYVLLPEAWRSKLWAQKTQVVCRGRVYVAIRVPPPDDTGVIHVTLKPLREDSGVGDVGV